ncbi:glycoside hydrolase family 5 protein [Kozakia baliensis]|uniref:glycoside hydrolase family 5 protein n=1 Tax=Kozakia baliensis TaxID=153496 RepID=UPI00345B93A5
MLRNKLSKFAPPFGVALLTLFQHAPAQTLKGVNLAGMEFNSGKIPGRYGWDYISPKDQEFDYYAKKGINTYRIPILWERLQPQLNGPLDPAELRRIQHLVGVAKQHNSRVLIDIHNYGRYHGQTIGTGEVTPEAFVDLWTRIAQSFKDEPKVMFGLMNEPQLPSATVWAKIEQDAINSIRRTGAQNRIFVSGIGWDGAHSFQKLNGDALAGLSDPANNLVYEVHQYFDKNYSGTSADCISPEQASQQLVGMTDWLRSHHAKGFLGEFGVGRSDVCQQDLTQAVKYMKANKDVWLGWTYWAGGPLWGNYMFTLEPTKDGQDRPQMDSLQSVLE